MIGALTGLITGLMGIGSQVGNYFLSQAQMEKQNRYNSPAAQMHRLRVAGINPYAAISQVAGQNQGQMATPDFDFGRAVGQAVNAYSTVENTEMNKALNEYQIQKLQQDIRGLALDNYFNGMTMPDRIKTVGYKAIESMADADSSLSLADINWLKAEWERYLAGYDSQYSPTVENYSEDGVDYVVTHKVPKLTEYSYDVGTKGYDYLIARDTYDWKVNYEKFKTLKTEQDYKIAVQRLIRETAAASYESATGMPWANKDPISHYIVKIIDIIKNMPSDVTEDTFWRYVWDNL